MLPNGVLSGFHGRLHGPIRPTVGGGLPGVCPVDLAACQVSGVKIGSPTFGTCRAESGQYVLQPMAFRLRIRWTPRHSGVSLR